MPARKTSKKNRPVILVPATPSTPDSVPVATEDDTTPPQPTQPSPSSYAQVAAGPAAAINAVVWPLNPTTSPAGGAMTQQAAATTNTATGRGAPLDAPPPPSMPSTPTLAPVVMNDEVIEPMELPPPAFPWAGEQYLGSSLPDATDVNAGLQPLSSPIYVPSTASATPTPVGGASVVLDSTQLRNAGAAQPVQSYEDFWSHFSSPSFPDTNLPSALQTPRAMAPLVNDVFMGATWPFQPQLNDRRSNVTSAADKENNPPGAQGGASQAPVTSRQRKRRRGLTPASNERAKKSARRKGKARANAAPPASGPLSGMTNPWATTCEDVNDDDDEPTPGQRPPPPSLPPSSFASSSSNQTPYAAFSRPASATTSFYGRFNVSGSYPTPHAVSSAPSSHASPSMMPSASQPPTRPSALAARSTLAPSHSVAPRTSRASSMQSVRTNLDLDVDDHDQGFQFEPPSGTSVMERYRDITMGEETARSEGSNRGNRRGLHDLLSDPNSLRERPRSDRSPTVEDVPEDGEEVEDERRARVASAFDWGPSANPSLYNAHLNPSRPARDADDAYRPAHEYEVPTRNDRQHRREAVPRPYLGSMGSRFTEEWDSRSPRRMNHDELPSRWSSVRSTQLPRGSPLSRLHHGSHPASHHTAASTATPSNRINSLDIFDTGEDDNMPEAVRRGGAATETENERPTPIPREGDPEVHRHDPEAHLRGMSDDWIQEVWADPSGTSITLSTFNPRYTRSYGANRRTASDIRSTVTRITGEVDFLVIAPDQARNYRGRGPAEWAVTGLSREGVDRLLRRRVWSFRSITFFPRRRSLDTPRWVIALEGFLEDNVANIESAVRSTFHRPQVRQRIEQMIRANPEFDGIEIEEAFRRIMETLRVTVYTLDNDTVVANVFLRSPTQSIRVWRCWVQELRDLTFGSHRTSIARARRVSECAGCSGVDHPSHLCPFLRMPGWNGPESADGLSYSVDGRERRTRQATMNSSSTDAASSRSQRNHPMYGSSSSQAGPSRQTSANARPDWDEMDFERGRDQRRDRYSNDRSNDRNNDRNGSGPSRRGRGDGSRPSKGGRENYRKEGRR